MINGSWGHGPSRWSILVHGGAGDVPHDRVPLHVAGCERAAAAGAAILARGGSAVDAVQGAVEALEDDPLFNAGTGACLNEEGRIELDASIMSGEDLGAGAVCALPSFRHPIAIARKVMSETNHLLLAGEGAVRFAIERGFERAPEGEMITELSRKKWDTARAKHASESWAGGTVGAVARDDRGHVAAATSTGGMVNKRVGRVGDSPIIGAGTYADDEAGACSTTGHGEAMMRICVAKTAVDEMRAKRNAEDSARSALETMERRTNEAGGAILVATDGSLGLARTTRTMSWAAVTDADRASGA
jgi:beta-aspartyl-peptidase (threonine type)